MPPESLLINSYVLPFTDCENDTGELFHHPTSRFPRSIYGNAVIQCLFLRVPWDIWPEYLNESISQPIRRGKNRPLGDGGAKTYGFPNGS